MINQKGIIYMTTDDQPSETIYQPDVVIYHDKCMDGFTAAWAIWKRWGDAPEYVARNYGMDPPELLTGKHATGRREHKEIIPWANC